MLKINKFFFLSLKIAITILLFYIISKKISNNDFYNILSKINYKIIILVFLILYLHLVFNCMRWHLILKQKEQVIKFKSTFSIFSIASFFNQFLPSAVFGEAIKFYYKKKLGLNKSIIIRSIILDRFIHTVVLIVILIMSSSALFINLQLGLIFSSLFLFFVFTFIVITKKIINKLNINKFFIFFINLLNDFKENYNSTIILLPNISLSLIVHSLMFSSYIIIGMSIGIDINLLEFFVILPIIIFASSLPISLNGWGIREFISMYLLNFYNVNETQAILMSVIIGLLIFLTRLPGSLFLLIFKPINKNNFIR
jgi:glycosyltransferase 2 family protein